MQTYRLCIEQEIRTFEKYCFSLNEMGKLLFVMLASFSVSTDVLLGGNVCNNYSDTGCVSPNSLKDGFYVNQWIVHLPGMAENQVRRLLEDNGFEYLGPVIMFHFYNILIRINYSITFDHISFR